MLPESGGMMLFPLLLAISSADGTFIAPRVDTVQTITQRLKRECVAYMQSGEEPTVVVVDRPSDSVSVACHKMDDGRTLFLVKTDLKNDKEPKTDVVIEKAEK